MATNKTQEKLAFNLTCHYYATPGEIEKCCDSLKMYLELEKHRKSLSAWELLAVNFHTDGSDMPDATIRIVTFGVRFIHKSMTLDDLGLARRTFRDTVDIVHKAMRALVTASVKERADPNSSAQKAAVKLIKSYMEVRDTVLGTNVSPMSSRQALRETCWRVNGAKGNTSPLWNVFCSTSMLECTSLQIDIDLAVYTMKIIARWYGELLQLFEMSIRSEEMKSQIIKAARLSKSMSQALGGENADVNGVFITSDELKRSLVGEQDWNIEKTTVVEMEKAYKAVRGGVDNQQPRKRSWWRRVLKAVGQLRLLAKEFMLMANIQNKWADLEALAKKPGVDISEVNKVTGAIDMVNLSRYRCDHHSVAGTASGVRHKNPATSLYAAACPEIKRRPGLHPADPSCIERGAEELAPALYGHPSPLVCQASLLQPDISPCERQRQSARRGSWSWSRGTLVLHGSGEWKPLRKDVSLARHLIRRAGRDGRRALIGVA
ncbi:uncharacterized protein LY79DRAFT_525019 [Colletotrichum navitas]|uniref:Uncharacterized protein n=1 Tax=Colletotrichum navitas TaxID=681940 RepID=A0AAD8UZP4_9PEZI|nr:uncharacterized protein LY79DRAFT_525019 [Colletotrichum navitas]KAK1573867.1 hypothetical protein LY79DRAFT_525019 [Colletotrichum navitas]